MYRVEHRLRIGIARGLKLVRAPLVLLPVVPVLHDVVTRYLALTELCQVLLYLTRGLIALTTLPEAQHPLGIDGGLACQRTIARDNLVSILSGNEVVVHILGHLTPNAEFTLVLIPLGHTQSTVADVTIWLPFYAQLLTLALRQHFAELIGVGVPGCTPTLSHHFLTSYIYLDISGIIEDEVVDSLLRCFDIAFIHHMGTIELEALGQVLDAPWLRTVSQF